MGFDGQLDVLYLGLNMLGHVLQQLEMVGKCSESSLDGLKPLFPSCRGKPKH